MVPDLPGGVPATGRTLEECRGNPAGVIDERQINGSGAGPRYLQSPAAPWERSPGRIPVPEQRIRPISWERLCENLQALGFGSAYGKQLIMETLSLHECFIMIGVTQNAS